MVWCQTT